MLLFVFFLFQQSYAGSAVVHPIQSDHSSLGMDHHVSERLSTSLEKNQHKDFHFVADVSFIIAPRLVQVISVERPSAVLNFLPLEFHLVYSQFTSTYL